MSEKQNEDTQTEELVEETDGEAKEAAPAQAEEADSVNLSELLRKLDEATAEISEQKERYLRTVADLENYRKRSLREKEEARRQANVGLMEDLLPVLDNFQLGLKSAEQHEGGAVFAEGFRMILSQLESALKQNGLEEINPGQELFDPNFHEAVAHIPHESVADGYIVEVHRVGYGLRGRLLRPAVVVISSGAPAEPSGEEAAPAES